MKFRILVILVFFQSISRATPPHLLPVKEFGPNPRGLRMYIHTPPAISARLPVVMVLHGCSQNARQCARLTDWNRLADRYGFIVIYPEQPFKNNPGRCFNWFTENNQTRDQGEVLSIMSMIRHTLSRYQADSSRIFVTGLSAGGAMTSNLLALYPGDFAAGAVFSGGAFQTATNFIQSLPATRGWILYSPKNLGDKVRRATPGYNGPWPRVAVFHGRADWVVNHRNANEIVKQWTNLHHTDPFADSLVYPYPGSRRVRLLVYKDPSGTPVVSYYEINRMGHKLATDPGRCPCQGGGHGMFARNKHFFSTYHAALFFGLVNVPCENEKPNSKKCR